MFFGFILLSFINGIKQERAVIKIITKALTNIVILFGAIKMNRKVLCNEIKSKYSGNGSEVWESHCPERIVNGVF